MRQMNKIIGLLFIIVVGCNTGETDHTQTDSLMKSEAGKSEDPSSLYSATTSDWLDSNLQPGNKTLTLEEQWTDDSLHSEPFVLNEEFISNYHTVLKWSPDSTYILDIGSYGSIPVTDENGKTRLEGGEPDTEIALIDRKNNERTRYIFVGPSSTIIDAKWLSNNEVVVLGTFKTDTAHADTLLWFIDRSEKLFRLYNVNTAHK